MAGHASVLTRLPIDLSPTGSMIDEHSSSFVANQTDLCLGCEERNTFKLAGIRLFETRSRTDKRHARRDRCVCEIRGGEGRRGNFVERKDRVLVHGVWRLIRIFYEKGSFFFEALLKLSAITCSLIDTFAAVESVLVRV